jgi:tetratricopeptide (TPR) repeat protein
MRKVVDAIQQSIQQKKYDEAVKLIDEFSEKNAEDAARLAPMKLALLAGFVSDPEKADALGRRLIKNAVKEKDSETLLRVAGALIEPKSVLPGDADSTPAGKKVDGRLLKVAVEAAEKADELSETTNPVERAQIANLLARAYRADGQTEKAVEVLDKASESLTDTIRAAAETLVLTNQAAKEAREEMLKSARTPPGSNDNLKTPGKNSPKEQDAATK